jgi:hypothetical protein
MSSGVDPELASSAFTEVFVVQLIRVIVLIPSHRAGGLAVDGLDSVL